MNEMERKIQFARLMAELADLLGAELSESIVDSYWNTLKRYPPAVLETAFRVLKERTTRPGRMPLLSEILDIIEGTPREKALAAWETLMAATEKYGVYRSVRFQDPCLARALKAVFPDGWAQVCNLTPQRLPFKKKEFVEEYLRFFHTWQAMEDPPSFPGLIEESEGQTRPVEVPIINPPGILGAMERKALPQAPRANPLPPPPWKGEEPEEDRKKDLGRLVSFTAQNIGGAM